MSELKQIDGAKMPRPIYEFGWAQVVDAASLHLLLGAPGHIVTDARRTASGEEEWWSYLAGSGGILAICYRSLSQDVVVYSSNPSQSAAGQAEALLKPFSVRILDNPVLRM